MAAKSAHGDCSTQDVAIETRSSTVAFSKWRKLYIIQGFLNIFDLWALVPKRITLNIVKEDPGKQVSVETKDFATLKNVRDEQKTSSQDIFGQALLAG
jgi:hypothetical protein